VSATQGAGGLVGYNTGSVVASYSTGQVAAEQALGGLVGSQCIGLVSDLRLGKTLLCFWASQATGVATGDGGSGKTTAEMMQAATFEGWGLDGIWVLDEGRDYPRLVWQGTPGEPIRDDPTRYQAGTGTPDDPFQIRTAAQLCAIGNHPGDFDAHFVVTQDLDCSDLDPGAFTPIGLGAFPFVGSFDGQGHSITGLTITEPNEEDIGLFGNAGPSIHDNEAAPARIANLALRDIGMQGRMGVGGLAGMLGRATVTDCTVTGRLEGDGRVGGLAGISYATVAHCTVHADIVAGHFSGVLLGDNGGTVESCRAKGTIKGEDRLGGLVGTNADFLTESEDGNCPPDAGGRIVRSCADCTVTGEEEIGGLVGASYECSRIESCYARGTVTGQKDVGGLVGVFDRTSVTNSYVAVAVSGQENAGGFLGTNSDHRHSARQGYIPGEISSCFWDTALAGGTVASGDSPDPNGLLGLATDQMQTAAPYIDAGWDFDVVWTIDEGADYPRLRWEDR
jgi:hypothetical protein